MKPSLARGPSRLPCAFIAQPGQRDAAPRVQERPSCGRAKAQTTRWQPPPSSPSVKAFQRLRRGSAGGRRPRTDARAPSDRPQHPQADNAGAVMPCRAHSRCRDSGTKPASTLPSVSPSATSPPSASVLFNPPSSPGAAARDDPLDLCSPIEGVWIAARPLSLTACRRRSDGKDLENQRQLGGERKDHPQAIVAPRAVRLRPSSGRKEGRLGSAPALCG